MVKKTHTQGGILFALLTSPFVVSGLDVRNKLYITFLIVVYLYGSYFGSLLPDIDMKSSYISKKLPFVYKLFGKHFKHRGFTHSILFFMILYLCSMYLIIMSNKDYVITLFCYGILVGHISHVFLDLFTKDGVYLFAPMSKTIRFAKIKTNSEKEKKVRFFLKVATVVAFCITCYFIILV